MKCGQSLTEVTASRNQRIGKNRGDRLCAACAEDHDKEASGSVDQASLQAAQDELAFLFLRGAAVGVCRSDFDQQFKAAHARVTM